MTTDNNNGTDDSVSVKRKSTKYEGKQFQLVQLQDCLKFVDGFEDAIGKKGQKELVKALKNLRLVEGSKTPILVVEKGTLPRHRGRDAKNINFELFVPASRVPNCIELSKSFAAMPHMLSGDFLRQAFSYGGYAANPSLVIDTMQILMTTGLIDQSDFDTVFNNVHPFKLVEWAPDEDYKADCIKAFMSMSNNQLPKYPPKGERTEEDAEAWFLTKPQEVLVKSWGGEIKANGKTFKTSFSVEKAVLPPDHEGRTRYHVGNRSRGDQPLRSQFLKLPGWSNKYPIHRRGRRSNVRDWAFAKMGAALRKRLVSGQVKPEPTFEDIYGKDVMKKLLDGETITL